MTAPSQSAPPEAFCRAVDELHGCPQRPGFHRQKWLRGQFGQGWRAAQAAAYEDAIPVIRHGKNCPNGLQDWMDERVDERGDCSASDCPTVMVVIRERAGRKE